MVHALVFNTVDQLNLGAATVHTKHPTDDYRTALTVKLLMIYFAFVDFDRTGQSQKWKNVFLDVMTVRFPKKFKVLIGGFHYALGSHIDHTSNRQSFRIHHPKCKRKVELTNIDAAEYSRLLNTAGVEAVRALPYEFIVYIFDVHDLHGVDEAAGTHAFPVN